jgi:hypothetical protein
MPPFFKFLAVIIIWVMMGLITLAQLTINDGVNFNWIFSLILFGIASGVTGSIVNDGNKSRSSDEDKSAGQAEGNVGKAKRDQQNGLSTDMLALLDDDDIADLRRRVKQRLIDRIEGGGDGELSSLDALLADQDTNPRKQSRR